MVQESLESSSRTVTTQFVGGGLPTEVPQGPDIIFGQITDPEHGSGSGNPSSGVNWDPNGPGFYDDDGYLAYAFQQIYGDYPWKGILIPGGIKTGLKNGAQPGNNFAYPLATTEISTGTNCILKRAGIHWVIVGVALAPSGSGSGGGVYHGTCPDGSTFTVAINGTTITVT